MKTYLRLSKKHNLQRKQELFAKCLLTEQQ